MVQIKGTLSGQGNIRGELKGTGGGGSGGAEYLTQLKDVAISTPSNNQVLQYDSVSEKWINNTLPDGVNELSELSDVTINNPNAGNALIYGGASGKWYNVTPEQAFPIWDEFEADVSMNELLGGSVIVTFDHDISSQVLDLHFNYSMVCPSSITYSYDAQTELYTLYISVPYQAVNDMKCLISLRNKRS